MSKENGNGFRVPKKPTTAKAMSKRMDRLEKTVQAAFTQVGMRLQEIQKEIVGLNNNIQTVDCRSLATLRMLERELEFVEGAHGKVAEEIRAEIFNEMSEAENDELCLQSVDRPAAEGDTVVFTMDAFEKTEDGLAGSSERINDLCIFRSKVQLGANRLPKEIEDQILGMTPRTSREFDMTIPENFGPKFSGMEVVYSLELLQVLEPETTTQPSESVSENVVE